ncbi:MAG: nitroreductase family protein [Nitrospirota bacterium]|nr:nitroreductase family protein [Nitrospirota bacterium]
MGSDITVNHDIHPLLRQRRSPRAFADRDLADDMLRALIEAARWAPSCFNAQPWRLLVTRKGSPAHGRLTECLSEGNRRWAPAAPVLILTVARSAFDGGRPNRHAAHDVGLAVGQLTLQATAVGLCVHQMGGFDPDRARAAFAVPDGFEPVTVVAIGYPGDPDTLPEDLREKELAGRTRMPLESFTFGGEWGTPL